MTPIVDKREEGLRALARMIAAAYRRRMTGETDTAFTASNGDEEHPCLKARTARTQSRKTSGMKVSTPRLSEWRTS